LRLLEARLKLRELAKEWPRWSERIAEAAEEILGPCEAYVFGSTVKGTATGASDVDILIISDRIPASNRGRGMLKAEIEEKAGLPLYHPFQIHLATREEAQENPVYRSATREGKPLKPRPSSS